MDGFIWGRTQCFKEFPHIPPSVTKNAPLKNHFWCEQVTYIARSSARTAYQVQVFQLPFPDRWGQDLEHLRISVWCVRVCVCVCASDSFGSFVVTYRMSFLEAGNVIYALYRPTNEDRILCKFREEYAQSLDGCFQNRAPPCL